MSVGCNVIITLELLLFIGILYYKTRNSSSAPKAKHVAETQVMPACLEGKEGIVSSYKTNVSGQDIEICFTDTPNDLLLTEEKIREDIQTKIDRILVRYETPPDAQEYKLGLSKMYIAIGDLRDLLKRPEFNKTMFTMDGLYHFYKDSYLATFESEELESLYDYLAIVKEKFDRFSPKIKMAY